MRTGGSGTGCMDDGGQRSAEGRAHEGFVGEIWSEYNYLCYVI